MGLLDLFKRTSPGQTIPLTHAQVDSNWQKIMDLFPTPANGNTDVGKTVVLKADKTGFNYAPVISSIIPGANISIDVTDPNNPVISAISNAMQSSKYLIAGGSVWSGTGLVYDVSLNYFFNGIKPSTQAQITLDASDATYDRFDAIVVDEDGVISIIKGTADANPITPTIPENQLLVQYILVGAGTVTPAITQEIIHSDEPTTNWTASNYTTAGGVVGTTDFTATTPTPFQGADCILNTRDGRTGVRFVRDTAINLADYTYVALRVFIPTALATNKSLVLRFENSAGVLIGTGINLFSYGINRNLIGVWQMAYVPTYAFGAINSIKGLKIILSGGTVGVTAQWAIDYVLLSTGSTPSANLPTITVSENGVAKGNTENIDFVDGDNTTVDVVKDNVSGKVKVKVNGGTQTLAISGNDLSISGGNTVVLPPDTTQVSVSKNGTLVGITDKLNFVAGTNTTVDVDNILGVYRIKFNNSSLQSLQAGDNITIDDTDPLNPIVSASGGGGGQIAFTKTKAEIDALIAGNNLVKNALYEITGVHPTLYDDGTTSGTTIYLRAISGNQLDVQGMGKFYNPKYDKLVDGFGIWDNKMYGTFSTIVGTFDYQNKETVTADNGATGILLADGMIQYVSGNWSSAISITGGTSSATANVADFVSPSYAINDKVIWGGYSWTNVNGNIGASTDVLNLDSEWSKDVYDTTNYNIAYDLIEYDYANDMIIRRHDLISNIDVRFDKETADLFVNGYSIAFNAISVQQFGNPFNLVVGKGVFNKLINNGYDESINFCGSLQANLTFGSYSYQGNLTFGSGSYQTNLTFGSGSNQYNLTFGSGSFQNNLTFGSGSFQNNLTFGNNSYQQSLTFGSYSYQGNLTFGNNSYQNNLTFGSGSQLNYNSQVISSNMEYINFNTKDVIVPDLSAATLIFDGNIKEVYQRPDGALKIRYYDNSDALVIADIAD